MINPELLTPEIIQTVEVLAAPVIGAIGLNFLQRKAIRERDKNECQSKDERIECGGRLEIDHIIPKEFAEKALRLKPSQYNSPSNLLTKCENHHRGHPNSHHPDMHQALYEYRGGDKDAIARAAKEHQRKAEDGEIYWNNENDCVDRDTAIENTRQEDQRRGGRKKWWPW